MQIQAQIRDKFGKATANLREQGLIPAELYGKKVQNVHLAVNGKEFNQTFKQAGANTVIKLVVGKDNLNALIHAVQRNSLTSEVEHIDFYQVRMDEVITAKVPLEIEGEAPVVKEQGGILNRTMTEIEVEALPGDLPHSILVNISSLKELNQSLYVKDLNLPKGVKVSIDPETVVVSVSEPMPEEVIPVTTDVSAVKVEAEEKKAEREKAGEAESQ